MAVDRLLIVAALVAVFAGLGAAAAAYRWAMARRATDVLRRERSGRWSERPEVFYFYTQDCVQCRAQQWPALEELAERLPERFTMHRIDALAEPGLADRFGIITVPSTVVVDRTGHVHALNYGYADVDRLEQQVHGAWDRAA